MPPNEAAAGITAAYRQQLLTVRDTVTRLVTGRLLAVDFDDDLAAQLAAWEDEAEHTIQLGQREATRLATGYMTAYLRAADLEPQTDPPEPGAHIGEHPFAASTRAAVATAPIALLWRLGRGDGREDALASGASRATRISRTSVMHASRATQLDVMDAEPRVAGWRRVTSAAPCGSCLGLAGSEVERGSMSVHDSCRCTSEPVLRGVRETVRRPTGQELFDRLDEAAQDALFAGIGGKAKADIVRKRGVGVLVDTRGGRATETRLADLQT